MEIKSNLKYSKPLVLVLSKLSGYAKIFKVNDKKNKLMSFRKDDYKLLEKYKTSWTKIEDFTSIELTK